MKKKIDLARDVINDNLNLLRCPICKQQLALQNNSLFCENGHCFDLSKNGYVNLLRNPVYSKYSRELFSSRRKILQDGFLNESITEVGKIILKDVRKKRFVDFKILDAGCGEGTNLANIARYIFEQSNIIPVGIGLDISKSGIYIAARDYPGHIWCVADLADSPLNDKQFDFVLNILSPANYSEFTRVLKKNGLLIKVIPGTLYLQEIRKIFYKETEKEYYSNKEIINLFQKNFTIINQQRLLYQHKIESNNILPLLEMTPLSWNFKIDNLEVEGLKFPQINDITVDLIILVGRGRE
jgi:23S rRNA (guanine745-N1)-methyltransferase